MHSQAQIHWKGLDSSPALTARIEEEIGALKARYTRLLWCRVVIEMPHRHHRHGRHFHVKLEAAVPGRLLAVTHDPTEHISAEDPSASVNEAFETLRRQLEEDFELSHQLVKAHARS